MFDQAPIVMAEQHFIKMGESNIECTLTALTSTVSKSLRL
jgi:hypothetical protein